MQNLDTMYGDKPTGSFYTPQDIASYISRTTIEAYLTRAASSKSRPDFLCSGESSRDNIGGVLDQIRIVDPAVGEGVFLLAAGEYLLQLKQRYGDTRDPQQIKIEIVMNNLFGVDLLPLPTRKTRKLLLDWCGSSSLDCDSYLVNSVKKSIRQGNSLVGEVGIEQRGTPTQHSECEKLETEFSWSEAFPDIFGSSNQGFDVLIANPPYGNLISKREKERIKATYPFDVTSGRSGSWNIACLFVVRSSMLLSSQGQMGLILPNSLLRVGQFQKIREFIFNNLDPWQIVDHGKAWDDVTLEMFTLFCSKSKGEESHAIEILSRREELEGRHWLDREKIDNSGIIHLYHDKLFDRLLERGEVDVLSGSRGRDIPSKYLRDKRKGSFSIPFATKGRSVGRFCFNDKWLKFVDNRYKTSKKHAKEIDEQFLIATKNLAYPRCVLKPKGFLHGGGVVKVSILDSNYKEPAIGLILNSRMGRYISLRYLTNYSKYTTCMNTGILDAFPIIYPEHDGAYVQLFMKLQYLREMDREDWKTVKLIDSLANAVVYSDYLQIRTRTRNELVSDIQSNYSSSPGDFIEFLKGTSSREKIQSILNHPMVLEIESDPRMR